MQEYSSLHSLSQHKKQLNRFFLSQLPPQGFPLRKVKIGSCAHHSLKAVIEGKKPQQTHSFKKYASGWWSRLSNFMDPIGMIKVLKRKEIPFQVLRGKKMNAEEKLTLLKTKIQSGPVILLIGNGSSRSKKFSYFNALRTWHYISLWGYDEEKKLFLAYDSNTPYPKNVGLMEGLIEIPYAFVLKSRSIGASKLLRNYGIAVSYH